MAGWWSDLRERVERLRAASGDRQRTAVGGVEDPYGDRRFARRLALSREVRAWLLTATAIVATLSRIGLLG